MVVRSVVTIYGLSIALISVAYMATEEQTRILQLEADKDALMQRLLERCSSHSGSRCRRRRHHRSCLSEPPLWTRGSCRSRKLSEETGPLGATGRSHSGLTLEQSTAG